MPDTLHPADAEYFRTLARNADPLYGMINLVRFQDRLIVTMAPTVGLINPEILFHDRVRGVRVHGDLIELCDQVTYRITGWDPDQKSLIVLLEADHR
jgi:hypothetical protein